jgi:hypothetical protein
MGMLCMNCISLCYVDEYGLRHCATNRNLAGSIPGGVIIIFHSHNPSGRTMTLGLTQPITVTQINTRNIACGRYVGLATLPFSCANGLEIWELEPAGTLWTWKCLNRDCFTGFTLMSTCRFRGSPVSVLPPMRQFFPRLNPAITRNTNGRRVVTFQTAVPFQMSGFFGYKITFHG